MSNIRKYINIITEDEVVENWDEPRSLHDEIFQHPRQRLSVILDEIKDIAAFFESEGFTITLAQGPTRDTPQIRVNTRYKMLCEINRKKL